MENFLIPNPTVLTDIDIGIAWCLAWGSDRQPRFERTVLLQMREALRQKTEVPAEMQEIFQQIQALQSLKFPETLMELQNLTKQHPQLWESKIGLVYGGATKIKGYVFESAKLQDIRGASALLDRINLVDLPAFFGNNSAEPSLSSVSRWLEKNFPSLTPALIPELIVYSTGGNLLAFCPVAFVHDLANAIEKRYTQETLTANSCAVGDTFRLLELRFGLLQDFENTFWLEQYLKNLEHPLIQAYFDQAEITAPQEKFRDRKNFNELVGKLATQFHKRRNGNELPGAKRPSRRYPSMFETHPYLTRDEGDRRSAVIHAKSSPDAPDKGLPGDPWFSEASARKRLMGQITKREFSPNELPTWWRNTGFDWEPGEVKSWVNKFEQFLYQTPHRYYGIRSENVNPRDVEEARSVREIADASTPKGFVAYIYADGNNMGGYIQKEIKNPEDYQRFSQDIFDATEKSVYAALAQHLKPHKYKPDSQSSRQRQDEVWIHPFEILTIGGDDVMLIVPADKALAIAQTIGEEFENQLLTADKQRYSSDKRYNPKLVHRYQLPDRSKNPSGSDQCRLSMSTGVLLAAEDTPIYYAEKLTSQLLKSAKKRAKDLKKELDYYGGTVDFLVMKSVTMISSNISDFRSQGLTKVRAGQPKLKLYAAPYTLYELGGLLETAKALKEADFPRSQLYQIRSLLEQGKHTAMLNYRYFRVRLKQGQAELRDKFEQAWCQPKDPNNKGNLAPWMSLQEDAQPNADREKMTYETIWRELVDLYTFIEEPTGASVPPQAARQGVSP